MIGNYYTGNVLDNPHLAQALAFGMFVVLAVDDAALHPAAAAGREVGEVKRAPRWRRAPYVWLAARGAYFFLPLYATFDFSLKKNKIGAPCCTLHNYGWVIHNGDFWHTIKISFILALETIVISLLLFVPTIYWVHLKVPKLRPVIAFMALVPFVVPPIVMVVGPAEDVQGHARLVLRSSRGASSRRRT